MSWGRHVREPELLLDVSRLTGAVEPVLLPDRRAEVRAALLERAARFTPEWVPSGRHDAGVALAGTYAALAETVHDRLDRLPARLLFELLDVAGVRALPARRADALMVVSADDDARRAGLTGAALRIRGRRRCRRGHARDRPLKYAMPVEG